MKDYELSVLFHPDLEMNIDPALDKIKKFVEQNGGKINSVEDDGKKRLAYPIKGQDFAIFYYYNVSLPSDAPAKISSVMNITDEVLRYLLVKADGDRQEPEAIKNEEATVEAEAEKEEVKEKGE